MGGTIVVLNGPNLNLLGEREPEIYGRDTLADVERLCREAIAGTGFEIEFRQTNAEHEMVGWLQDARRGMAGIVINPAAFTYAAYAVLDAIKLADCPVIEVHLSNIHRREAQWRANSIHTQVCTAIVSGMGIDGYVAAVRHLVWLQGRGT